MKHGYGKKADKLIELQQKFARLVEDCKDVLEGTGIIKDRAESYWLGHIEHAIEQINKYDQTMETTIKELRREGESEEDDDE